MQDYDNKTTLLFAKFSSSW